ncbi:MAG TPA: lysophospholipid acyltransferase family protein [Puia sp.]
MRILLKPLWWLYCLYALLLFIVGMLCVLPFVAVLSLQTHKNAGDSIYHACYIWDKTWMTLVGIRHTNIFEAIPDAHRQYVFVSNHISYLDIPLILRAIRCHSFRVLGKAEMRRMPLFGYIYSRAVVMVDRSDPHERSKSVRELKSVLAQGSSVFIFPEGTFNETHRPLKEFFDGAFRIAIETQTPIQPILFLNTYDRMHYSSIFCLRPGPTRAVFLPAIAVEGLDYDDLPALRGQIYRLMEEKLVEYQVSWIKKI